MEIPIPFALSLVITAASMAMATKIIDSNKPIAVIISPIAAGAKKRIGKPAPMRNEHDKEPANPVNKLLQMCFLFSGWLTSNSINSALL